MRRLRRAHRSGEGKAPQAKGFAYHEKLLELKEIDVVLIGSPDHWHKQHAVDAMEAGKDVYVEKPLCRVIREGLEMVKTARVTNRICQVGLQQRSGQVYIEARERFIRSGMIGRVVHVKAFWNNPPASASRRMTSLPAEKPSNLDWARFLGPVKWREWNPMMYFNFRAFLEFNGGLMTDFGHHWMDVVHMFLGERPRMGSPPADCGWRRMGAQPRTKWWRYLITTDSMPCSNPCA